MGLIQNIPFYTAVGSLVYGIYSALDYNIKCREYSELDKSLCELRKASLQLHAAISELNPEQVDRSYNMPLSELINEYKELTGNQLRTELGEGSSKQFQIFQNIPDEPTMNQVSESAGKICDPLEECQALSEGGLLSKLNWAGLICGVSLVAMVVFSRMKNRVQSRPEERHNQEKQQRHRKKREEPQKDPNAKVNYGTFVHSGPPSQDNNIEKQWEQRRKGVINGHL